MLLNFSCNEGSKSVTKQSEYGSFDLLRWLVRIFEPNAVKLLVIPGIWTRLTSRSVVVGVTSIALLIEKGTYSIRCSVNTETNMQFEDSYGA